MKTGAELLDQFETEQTKHFNNEQLHRFVLLKQVRVLTLQQQNLERMGNIETGKDITIDFVNWEGANNQVNIV